MKRREYALPDAPVRTTFSTAEVLRDPSRPSLVQLLLDGVESSALDLDDPDYLEFEYMQHIRAIIESRFPPHQASGTRERHLKFLHLGGAGCALARSLGARQTLHQTAVEIDAELATHVREWFALPPAPFLKIRVGDARKVLDATKASWDAIIRDAFLNRNVPAHLSTLESAERASLATGSNGIYVINAVASAGIRKLDEDIAAMAEAFPHIVGVADPAIFGGKRFGNVVVAGSHTEFDLPGIEREIRKLPLVARVYDGDTLRKRAASVRPTTDAAAGWVPAASAS